MGSVFKTKDGNWRGAVDLPKKPNGTRNQKSIYPDPKLKKGSMSQKKDVQRQVDELEYLLTNNLYIDETKETVEQYFPKWLKAYCADRAETTKELYQMYIDVHVIPALGTHKMKDIKPIQIQEFYNDKLKTLSPNTVGKLHTFLNRAFLDAYKNRIIKYNPLDGVTKPKKKKVTHNIVTEENFYNLLTQVEGTFDEVCILLAGVCGLRRAEVFGLRRIDIDFKNHRITIAETMVRFNSEWIIKPPKNETSQRTINVPPFVTDVIHNYLSSLKMVPERICAEFKPGSYSEHFSNLLKKLNLPHVRFHDLRHFNATIMLKYGISDKVASQRLGHSQVQTTREIYQHVLPDMDSHASNVLEGVFTKTNSSS